MTSPGTSLLLDCPPLNRGEEKILTGGRQMIILAEEKGLIFNRGVQQRQEKPTTDDQHKQTFMANDQHKQNFMANDQHKQIFMANDHAA